MHPKAQARQNDWDDLQTVVLEPGGSFFYEVAFVGNLIKDLIFQGYVKIS